MLIAEGMGASALSEYRGAAALAPKASAIRLQRRQTP